MVFTSRSGPSASVPAGECADVLDDLVALPGCESRYNFTRRPRFRQWLELLLFPQEFRRIRGKRPAHWNGQRGET